MIWNILIAFVSFLILYKLYTSLYQPYKLYFEYKTNFKKNGIKVIDQGFIPLLFPFFLKAQKEAKQYKDGLYSIKNTYPEYDVMICNFGNKVALHIMNEQLLKDFYANDVKNYEKQLDILQNFKRFVGQSLMFSEKERWKKKRKLFTHVFNYNYLKKKQKKLSEIASEKLAEFSKDQSQFQVNTMQMLTSISSTTILQLFFGGGSTDINSLQIEGKKLNIITFQIFEDVGNQLYDVFVLLFGQQFLKWGLRANDRKVNNKLKIYFEHLTYFIKDRLHQIEQNKGKEERDQKDQDYVERVCQELKIQKYTDQFVQDLVNDFSLFLVAGTDTTSISIMMLLFYCSKDKQILRKAQKQIDETFGQNEEITEQKIKTMIYLDAIFCETIRIHSPVHQIFYRKVTGDHYLGQTLIKKGTIVTPFFFGLQYDPKNYENPFEFRPQRWIKEDGSIKSPKPFTWISFSGGPRTCAGRQLAEMEIKIVTITILKKYDLLCKHENLSMTYNGSTYHPEQKTLNFRRRVI